LVLVLLRLTDIQKRYGGVTALRSANLSVAAGEVHLLLGENGAGKSTLMKIVAGLVEPDGGTILWNGSPVKLKTPADAAKIGVAMVHQESLLAPQLTVAENIFLGREDRLPFGWIARRRAVEKAARLIEQHKFPLQADWRVERLSPAGKQLVEICRAIQHGSSLLIFDEPTSSLSGGETEEVFRIVRTLRDRKMGVIYITHRLEELRAIGDTVTVLRDGETVHTGPLRELSTGQIISQMVGRQIASTYSRTAHQPGAPVLEAVGLTVKGKLHNVSLTLRAGEITGMAGLIGAGRTELCRALFGIDALDAGSIKISGKPVRINSPRAAVQAGIALVTEDRQITGLALPLSISVNATMANTEAISNLGFLQLRRQNEIGADYIAKLRIKAQSPRQPAGQLSGGNQQKVVIAKWLFREPRIFLFDEPTRGIDVGAKVEVFDFLHELAGRGAAILMVSSEIPELLQVADRILVMRQGEISGELPAASTPEEIMSLATLSRTQTEAAV
jgi:ABC-type sugar transport system ATPase subunit